MSVPIVEARDENLRILIAYVLQAESWSKIYKALRKTDSRPAKGLTGC